jgi:hypothetical protein
VIHTTAGDVVPVVAAFPLRSATKSLRQITSPCASPAQPPPCWPRNWSPGPTRTPRSA